mgnify:CR=1 FL=1
MYWGFIIVMVLITYGSVWTKDHSFEVSRYIIVVSVISALFYMKLYGFGDGERIRKQNRKIRI